MGLNYAVDGKVVQIFHAEGMELKNGQWLRSTGSYGLAQECEPCSETMDVVNTSIEELIEAGQGDQIAQIQLGSHEAVTLFLEGILRLKHFTRAYEAGGFVILPAVRILGGFWPPISVRISRVEHCIALLDNSGNVLKPVLNGGKDGLPESFIEGDGEFSLSVFEGGIGDFSDMSGEDSVIEAFEQGRFAQAA